MLLSHHDNSVSVLPVLPAVRGASEKISDSVARIQCHQEVDPKVELGVACSQRNRVIAIWELDLRSQHLVGAQRNSYFKKGTNHCVLCSECAECCAVLGHGSAVT